MTAKKQNGPWFYGWMILLCGMIITACSTGILSYFNALFVEPVTTSLGIGRTSYSLCSTICTVTTMVLMPIAGRLYQKYPLKALMLLGTACGGAALMIYSISTSIYGFYVGGFLAGTAMSFCGALPMTIIINNWFVEKRGIVTGIAYTGSAVVSTLLSTFLSSVIEMNGYSYAYRFLAALFMGLMMPMILLILKVDPSAMGQKAYGSAREQDCGEPEGLSKKQILLSASFWLFALSVFLLGMITYGTQSHLIANWTSKGISPGNAATLYSVAMAASAFSKLFLGGLYDKFGMAKGSTILCLIGTAALVSLAAVTQGYLLVMSAILFGMMTSLQVLITSYGVSRLFGQREYSAIFGMLNTFLFCGVSVGVSFSAMIFDHYSSYRPAWWIYAVLMLVCMAALLKTDALSKQMYKNLLGVQRGV